MAQKDPDRFERTIDLRAPRSRVWRAISTPKEVGTWFGLGESLELIGDFVPGAKISGKWTIDGKETTERFCIIEAVEPEHRLSFLWVPYEVPPGEDPDQHLTTRVEFLLEELPNGTRLKVSETGFAKLPPDKQYKRDQNETGWTRLLEGIDRYLRGSDAR